MYAVCARHPSSDDPLGALCFGERPEAVAPDDTWTVVTVEAAGLNHHDLWTLRGAGLPADRYPMILGGEASGTDEATARSSSARSSPPPGGATSPSATPPHPPQRRSSRHLRRTRRVPRHVLAPKPPGFTHAEAACVTGTWLTAYRMLFTKSGLTPGDTVLVQGPEAACPPR
ncbi:MDR/zinc-dependent alcohol dehydrogenase-like family protein [Streptomyces sp. L7]